MSYDGPRMAALFDEAEERHWRGLLHELADHGGEIMTDRIRELTPVGHQPFKAGYIPGRLRESIRQKVVVVYPTPEGLVFESGSDTNVEYAEYVEEGTGLWGPRRAKYEIRPRNPDGWLRFHDQRTGELIFAKRVMHPGSPGAHMFAKGVAMTEPQFLAWAETRVDRWARETEARWALKGRTERIRS